MLALIAPGQGSQSPGMLRTWLEDSSSYDLIKNWSQEIDLDLAQLGQSADADEIKDTAKAQPLIVATSLLAARALGIKNYAVVAGHSVGELTAAVLCGAISDVDALRLVRARGVEMAKAASQHPSGMSAVLGGEPDEVRAKILALGLIAANENGGGQIVAAGDLAALALLSENPPQGSRIRALAVAGAFHSAYMSQAVAPVTALASTVLRRDCTTAFISNKDGGLLESADDILLRIVEQIANPVRWDLCMASLNTMGVTGVIELAPAGTLVGLVKRAYPEIEVFALKSRSDLNAAHEFAERHT